MKSFSPANGILLVERPKAQPMKTYSATSFSPANGILLVESVSINDAPISFVAFQSRERDSIS